MPTTQSRRTRAITMYLGVACRALGDSCLGCSANDPRRLPLHTYPKGVRMPARTHMDTHIRTWTRARHTHRQGSRTCVRACVHACVRARISIPSTPPRPLVAPLLALRREATKAMSGMLPEKASARVKQYVPCVCARARAEASRAAIALKCSARTAPSEDKLGSRERIARARMHCSPCSSARRSTVRARATARSLSPAQTPLTSLSTSSSDTAAASTGAIRECSCNELCGDWP